MTTVDTYQSQYEELLEFVYLSPFALARIDETGAIDMMNSLGASVLMDIAETPELTNLFQLLDGVDPGVRELVASFAEERGPICEGHAIRIERPDTEHPLVLSLNLLKLGPGRIMAAFSDISKLEAAHTARRFLLDNVSDGLLTVDGEGRMSDQGSATLVRWLGQPTAGERIWKYFADKNPQFGFALQMGWEDIIEGFMPLALCLDQLPRRLDVDGIPLGVQYEPLMSGGKLAHVLIVLRDLTAEIERERLSEEQRELMTTVTCLTNDRDGFRLFFEESSRLVRRLQSTSEHTVQARDLHTLKGNCGIDGLSSVARMCHDCEEQLVAEGAIEPAALDRIASRWAGIPQRISPMLGDSVNTLTVTRDDCSDLRALVLSGAPRETIVERIESLTLTAFQSTLRRFGEQAVSLGARLDKGPLRVRVDGHGLRFHPASLTEFWSAFVHAVRNAVDHGVETPDERARAGKPEAALIELSARAERDSVVVELRDDGRGIAWDKVATKARAAGLAAETRADLEAALFTDGISSRDAVTETSGRGVGMGALKAACESLGGRVEVDSTAGVGTAFRFWLPKSALGRETLPPPRPHADAFERPRSVA